MKHVATTLLCGALTLSIIGSMGCASSVQTGALVGAGAGVVAGAGVGFVITTPELAGSSADGPGGDTSLPKGEAILASMAVGAVFGTIIGMMAGHQSEQTFVRRKVLPPPPPDSEPVASSTQDPILGNL